ncbi:MAG: InlB B-repeat-containing protein [Atopobiaceae bacterium]|nr:InlB B-repeat-containing protein [Atopobiaceae bacterium]
MTWQESSDYGYGCRLGVEWNESNTNGGTYKLAPSVWRLDQSSTDNNGSSFSETLKTEPDGSTGYWSGLRWGSGSGWRKVDYYSTRTYSKGHSAKTIKLTVSTDSEFGTWSGSFHYLGAKSFTASITIPARTSYSVTFNANGGSGAPSAQTKWYAESLTLSSTKPTFSGYAFKRWNTNTSDTGTAYSSGGSYTGNAALTLYAIWNRTVTYNKNTTDTVGSLPSSQTAVKSSAITLSSNTPTRTNYVFYHWNTGTTNAGTTYAKGGSYAANKPNVTLYAIWNPILYYKANGGSGADQSQTKTYGTAATLKAADTFSNEGYTFKRWNTNALDTGTAYGAGASFTGNVTATLYAIWNQTITYDANGGAGAPAAQTDISTNTMTISEGVPTRSGHTFLGWNTEPDGTGTDYAAGDEYSGGNVTLYAKWRVDIVLSDLTCRLVDANGTADPLGGYVKVTASYDSTSSGADVDSITASIDHSGVTDTQTEDTGLGLTGSVEFTFGPYSYADFDPHGGYSVGTITAENDLGSVEKTLDIAYTAYSNPRLDYITVYRAEAVTSGGVTTYERADDGTDLGIDAVWSVYGSATQTSPSSITVNVTNTKTDTLVATRTFSNISGTSGNPTTLAVYADPVAFPDDVLDGGVLLSPESQYSVSVTLSDAYSDSATSAKASRSDIVTIAYFTMDFLGDAYLYNKTEDTAVDPLKTYYTRSGYGNTNSPYVFTEVDNPTTAGLADYYEANGPKPGHGVAIGKPSTREGLDVGMETWFGQDVHVAGGVDSTGDLEVGGGVDVVGSIAAGGEVSATDASDIAHNLTEKANQTDVDTALANKVNKSGDTMTGALTMNAAYVYCKNGNLNRDGTYPTSATYGTSRYVFYDKDGEQIGQIRALQTTSDRMGVQIGVINEKADSSGDVGNWLTLYADRDGNYTYGISNAANFRSTISAKVIPTSLYNNTTGTTGTVTLSSSAANYNHLRIYCKATRGNSTAYNSFTVYSPNGKTANLHMMFIDGYYAYHFFKNASISGTSITQSSGYGWYGSGSNAATTSNQNHIYIVRVEGWSE